MTLGLPSLSLSDEMLAQALAAYPPGQILGNYFMDDPCLASIECYKRVQDSQSKSDPFHEAYESIIAQFFCCQFDNITLIGYEEVVKELSEAVQSYLQHPGLLISGHIAHHRLADLYMLYSLFQALHREALVFNAKRLYLSGDRSEMPRNYAYMSARQLQHMWANLLGVA
jgi:hypothetical protein